MWFALVLAATGCAAAGASDPNGGGDGGGGGGGGGGADAYVPDAPPPDACIDTDHDTVCDAADQCPGIDDRIDVNANGVPDCKEQATRTIDVKKVGTNYWRGWQANTAANSHDTTNDNTVTGAVGSGLYNSYFVFSLAGFTASAITSVKLELEMESYVSSDASESISVWDVTTPSATVETTAQNTTIYNDLGGGVQYGSATVTSASVSATAPVQFMLNAQAATDVKAKLGAELVVGCKVDATPGYVRFSATTEARIARIVVTYTP
jgi:hypothetical protein